MPNIITREHLHRLTTEHIIAFPFLSSSDLTAWEAFAYQFAYQPHKNFPSWIEFHMIERNKEDKIKPFVAMLKKLNHDISALCDGAHFCAHPFHLNHYCITKLIKEESGSKKRKEPGGEKRSPVIFREKKDVLNLSVHLVIAGKGDFFRSKSVWSVHRKDIAVKPGDCIFIRGTGFGGKKLIPYYGVENIVNDCYIVNMRQK